MKKVSNFVKRCFILSVLILWSGTLSTTMAKEELSLLGSYDTIK
jgi:hypothetical protein